MTHPPGAGHPGQPAPSPYAPTGFLITPYRRGRPKQYTRGLPEQRPHLTVVLDGTTMRVPFEPWFVSASPGLHDISVYSPHHWWPYILRGRGRPSLALSLAAGQTRRLRYDGVLWQWQSEGLSVEAPDAASSYPTA